MKAMDLIDGDSSTIMVYSNDTRSERISTSNDMMAHRLCLKLAEEGCNTSLAVTLNGVTEVEGNCTSPTVVRVLDYKAARAYSRHHVKSGTHVILPVLVPKFAKPSAVRLAASMVLCPGLSQTDIWKIYNTGCERVIAFNDLVRLYRSVTHNGVGAVVIMLARSKVYTYNDQTTEFSLHQTPSNFEPRPNLIFAKDRSQPLTFVVSGEKPSDHGHVEHLLKELQNNCQINCKTHGKASDGISHAIRGNEVIKSTGRRHFTYGNPLASSNTTCWISVWTLPTLLTF